MFKHNKPIGAKNEISALSKRRKNTLLQVKELHS